MSPGRGQLRLKDALWALAGLGLAAAIGRTLNGLGMATNLSDALPWGLWKVFNMVAGAALSSSAFLIALVLYVLQVKRYRPLARLAVIIGFLGYGSSLLALLFDLGLPHRFWHPFLMWNAQSFLFEVFWCVSVYWMVTAFELMPVLTERLPWPRLTHFFHSAMLPAVVLGVTLSTMHHSSLGALFMVSPTRLHPLWYTTWVPVEFLISAMGGGLAVLILVALACARLYGRGPDRELLQGPAFAAGVLLAIFLVLRITDLGVHHKWGYVFGADAGWERWLFLIEITVQAVLPALILLTPRLRRNPAALATGAALAATGLVIHRMDTGLIGYFRDAGATYYPSLSELALTVGVLAAAGLAFMFLVERFRVLPAEDGAPAVPPLGIGEVKQIAFGADTVRRGLIFALAVGLGLIVSWEWNLRMRPFIYPEEPVTAAVPVKPGDDSRLIIDGNRAGLSVEFGHASHQDMFACSACHHLNRPGDVATACAACHRDMSRPTEIFDHDSHRKFYGGSKSCIICHRQDQPRAPANAKACVDCHGPKTEQPMSGMKADGRGYARAPGYRAALHGVCLRCHRKVGQELDCMTEPRCLGNCGFCHPEK
jgi:Ni/Fe-hydrogenase subunit HybB-like protein